MVVQLVRILACHAGGRGFESHPFRQTFTHPSSNGQDSGFSFLQSEFDSPWVYQINNSRTDKGTTIMLFQYQKKKE